MGMPAEAWRAAVRELVESGCASGEELTGPRLSESMIEQVIEFALGAGTACSLRSLLVCGSGACPVWR
jgi:hypothetical protein